MSKNLRHAAQTSLFVLTLLGSAIGKEPEDRLVGKWTGTLDSRMANGMRAMLPDGIQFKNEYRADGTCSTTLGKNRVDARWSVVNASENTVSINVVAVRKKDRSEPGEPLVIKFDGPDKFTMQRGVASDGPKIRFVRDSNFADESN